MIGVPWRVESCRRRVDNSLLYCVVFLIGERGDVIGFLARSNVLCVEVAVARVGNLRFRR